LKKMSKNAKFHAGFESVEKVVKKCFALISTFLDFDCKCA
jgi:hypothetical protein